MALSDIVLGAGDPAGNIALARGNVGTVSDIDASLVFASLKFARGNTGVLSDALLGQGATAAVEEIPNPASIATATER